VKIESVISVVGFMKGLLKEQPGCLDVLRNLCTIRTLLVKIRTQFKYMNRTIEANSIKLVVDKKAFFFKEAKEYVPFVYEHILRLWTNYLIGRISTYWIRSTSAS